jgi:hypothetical protein
MRATAAPVEGNRVRLSIEVDESEVDEAVDATARRLARQIRVPGFRPGHVPRPVLEARLGGASEIFYLGASEVKARGASERMYIGASQWMMRGASERRLGGASEVRLAGASERRLAGASESRLAGASERRLAGASEARLGGASEAHFMGASEARLADAKVTGDGSYPSPDSIGSKPPVKE